ncbi:hypothetical protein O9X98_15900 [Agrobacterium salinitolerans]|nr:hypothetical protein [Agrobacterium salinitolerans]
MIDRALLISELQELRTSIGDYHNHKEQAAYTVFALSVAVTSWALISVDLKEQALKFLILTALVLLHFVVRWQLIKRRHAAQLYRVYSASIRRILQMPDENLAGITVQQTPPKSLRSLSSEYLFRSYLFPCPRESWPDLANSYPVFDVVHEEIENVVARVRFNPIIEVLPSMGSLACVALVGLKIAGQI